MVDPGDLAYLTADPQPGQPGPDEDLTPDEAALARLLHRHLTADQRLSPVRLLRGAHSGSPDDHGFTDEEIHILLHQPDQLRHLGWLWRRHPPVFLQAIARRDDPEGRLRADLLAGAGHPLEPASLDDNSVMWDVGLFTLISEFALVHGDPSHGKRNFAEEDHGEDPVNGQPVAGISVTDDDTDTLLDFIDRGGRWGIRLTPGDLTGPVILAVRWRDGTFTTHRLTLQAHNPGKDPEAASIATDVPTSRIPDGVLLHPDPP